MSLPTEWFEWEVGEDSLQRLYISTRSIYDEVVKGLAGRGAKWSSGRPVDTYEPKEVTNMVANNIGILLCVDASNNVYYSRASSADRLKSAHLT